MNAFAISPSKMEHVFAKYQRLFGNKIFEERKRNLNVHKAGCSGCGGSCVSGCAERGGCGPHGPK